MLDFKFATKLLGPYVNHLKCRIMEPKDTLIWNKYKQFFLKKSQNHPHYVKIVRIQSYSGPYFPEFGLNAERYGVSLRVQPECGKIRTRITPNTDFFHAVPVRGTTDCSWKQIKKASLEAADSACGWFWVVFTDSFIFGSEYDIISYAIKENSKGED